MAGRGVAAQAVAPRPVIVRIGLLGGDLTMMRKRLRLLLFLLFTFCFVPSAAFAETPNGVVYSEETDSGNYRVFVCAPNRYEAGIYAVGGDPNYLSSDVRSKLSDPSYGGSFYTYCQSFEDMESFLELPIWVVFSISPTARISEFMRNNTTYSLYKDAVEDYKRVLAGEDLGVVPPSSDIPAGDYYEIELTDNINPSPSDIPCDKIYYSVDLYNAEVASLPNASLYGFVISRNKPSASYTIDLSYSSSITTNSSGSQLSISANYWNTRRSVAYSDRGKFFWSTGTPSWTGYSTNERVTNITVYTLYRFDPSNTPIVTFGNPTPDGDWPDSDVPVTPDPPEVPTPTAPTVTPDPTPTEPTVVWPTAPIVVNPPEVTVEVTPSGLDYTELLTRINDNLNSIDSYTQAINASLNSLRTDVLEGFDDVVTSIRNVYRYLQHLNDVLEVHCKHIRDSIDDNVYELELYLKSLLHWLADQLSYDELYTYDDTAVTSLLNRILYKIPGGNGPVTYKPNPQSDEPGFFDWLSDLWHRFLIDLVSVLPDELGGLVNAFSQLTHYFPFSIPWDLFALFALFEHEPVTPVFDIPWGYGGESGDVQMIRIDLSVWDGVMSMIRPVFIVGFCFKLAMITKDLLSNFDINKGGI